MLIIGGWWAHVAADDLGDETLLGVHRRLVARDPVAATVVAAVFVGVGHESKRVLADHLDREALWGSEGGTVADDVVGVGGGAPPVVEAALDRNQLPVVQQLVISAVHEEVLAPEALASGVL